ncbi:CLUMA_CG012538, isoform A [Clunio marinus]|uniref:CLUMA_CG012538, isoform A n=1 Tax=Clunio marinus TaxID=568069 RepID=A0A1J1IG09_9DIPT|nr:CLUMA_CG012538, isoform A [Clunio marinus]
MMQVAFANSKSDFVLYQRKLHFQRSTQILPACSISRTEYFDSYNSKKTTIKQSLCLYSKKRTQKLSLNEKKKLISARQSTQIYYP